jgi:EAL domain-containing protein (putative c-di-GMP-specific phosphodiesterase class I)
LECDLAQGYHLCKPLPVDAFDTWCAERAANLKG